MTALYFPEGVAASDLLPRLGAKGVVVAGGLLGSIKGTDFICILFQFVFGFLILGLFLSDKS